MFLPGGQVNADSHELLMMAITALVCLLVGYVAGSIIQRLRDIREFDHEEETLYRLDNSSTHMGQRAA